MYNTELPNKADLPSSGQLLRSTVIAIVVAAVLLTTVVLPSEYGIDPTGIGRVAGLTQMGEIKMTLAEEAKRDREADASRTAAGPAQQPAAPATAPPATGESAAGRTDSMTVTLKPGQGIEIKLEMVKGATAKYDWTTTGGGLNFDLHGDNTSNAFISYKKGTSAESDSGDLVANFDGSHGWFWRNRTNGDVTITLKTSGEYTDIKRVV